MNVNIREDLRKKAMKKKEAANEKAAVKLNTAIIAKKPITTEELFSRMLSSIKKVDLVETLQKDLADPLLKYIVDGNVSTIKIPMNLYIVAIILEIGKIAEINKWQIAKEHDVLYLFNGIFWQRVEDEQIKA